MIIWENIMRTVNKLTVNSSNNSHVISKKKCFMGNLKKYCKTQLLWFKVQFWCFTIQKYFYYYFCYWEFVIYACTFILKFNLWTTVTTTWIKAGTSLEAKIREMSAHFVVFIVYTWIIFIFFAWQLCKMIHTWGGNNRSK